MHYPTSVLAILILVGVARADDSDKSWQIHGQVVDEQGMPIEDFEAATYWSSNGNWWDEEGELLNEAAAGKLWKDEGCLLLIREWPQSGYPREDSASRSMIECGFQSSLSTNVMSAAALPWLNRARRTNPSRSQSPRWCVRSEEHTSE